MKWTKLGKIFDPTEHKLANNCFEFAQAPQALVCDDYIRIYFSTREKDRTGKFLSHVSFVDMDKNFSGIKRVASKTVIPLGSLGCFDEHGIFPFHVVRDRGKILAYTTGWNRKVSVSADASIGLAISQDNGETFRRFGSGPVLTSSLEEPFLVGDGFVLVQEQTYHMWYIFGAAWKRVDAAAAPDRIYKITHATSDDGILWRKENRAIINDRLSPDECQALPSVIESNNRYHMYFCYREATDFRKNKHRAYRLGYAFSDDLHKWIRDDENAGIGISDAGWDSEMMCYPHVFQCDKKVYMLYNGNEFGRHGFGLARLES